MATKKHSKTTKQNNAWFIATRGSYLPRSSAGWLSYIPFLAYLIFVGIVGFKDTDSNAVAILLIIPNWVAAAAIMTYIAARKI